jgi:hypothetical protein
VLPTDRTERIAALQRWIEALQEYPRREARAPVAAPTPAMAR